MTPAVGDIYVWEGRAFRITATGPAGVAGATACMVSTNPLRRAEKTFTVPAEADGAAVFIGTSSQGDWDSINGTKWRLRAEAQQNEVDALRLALAHAEQKLSIYKQRSAQRQWDQKRIADGEAKLRKLREFKRKFLKLAQQYTVAPRRKKAKKK